MTNTASPGKEVLPDHDLFPCAHPGSAYLPSAYPEVHTQEVAQAYRYFLFLTSETKHRK
jgi:hypothetical protein